MTNAAIAAVLLAGGTKTPQEMEVIGTRILTKKGTTTTPTNGCGVGNSDTGSAIWNLLGDLLCSLGADTPQDVEEIQTIVCTRGHRTDTLNY